jgi:CheY-like chemotaxis protein
MIHRDEHPPHILLVDDDPEQLRLLVTALRHAPYRVSVALRGDQGYARAAVLLPDLILLDVQMPGRSGMTIARQLKANPATRHIPILFLSGMTAQPERLAGLRAGAVDYINKPFDLAEVLERIRIHLSLARQANAQTPRAAPPAEVAASPTNAMLKQVATEFILGRLDDPALTGAGVANSLNVSTRRLNAVFQAADGLSMFGFVRRERMRRAALMLGQSTLAIADVALEVGYANPANFATEFRKFWGMSPTQLRNQSQVDFAALRQRIAARLDASDAPHTPASHADDDRHE